MRQYSIRTTACILAMFLATACERDTATDTGGADSAPAADQAAAAETIEIEVPALPRSAAPDGARVWFLEPADGATVTSPVKIEFGSTLEIVKAGVQQEHSGHHHLIVDADLPDPSLPIPADANYIHFGDASTSTELELAPGEHRLTLLLGDYLHLPHDPPIYSDSILITVTN